MGQDLNGIIDRRILRRQISKYFPAVFLHKILVHMSIEMLVNIRREVQDRLESTERLTAVMRPWITGIPIHPRLAYRKAITPSI